MIVFYVKPRYNMAVHLAIYNITCPTSKKDTIIKTSKFNAYTQDQHETEIWKYAAPFDLCIILPRRNKSRW